MVVTVTIAPSARGHAVIEMNVNGVNRGMTSVTYRSCRTAGGFYAQGIAFTHPPFRGCVPVDVTVAGPGPSTPPCLCSPATAHRAVMLAGRPPPNSW